MTIDATTIGVIFGFFGVVVTSLSGIFIALRTNKTEKVNTAQTALEKVRDEANESRITAIEGRVTLRDEQILVLKAELAETKAELTVVEDERDALLLDNQRLRGLRP